MADIDKELRDIKNAVYGKEVRGSIHDGIKKINDESEESKEKANEAHDVMEAIMEEGFDNAALESNFEQKLDNKIANLQPEWTGFKEDITTQLAEIPQQISNAVRPKADKIYVDDQFSKIGSGSPKGAFTTLSDLETTYPNGDDNIYVVAEDNNWYYWNGSDWQSGGLYNATVSSEFPATNVIKNGDFKTTEHWRGINSELTAKNNILTINADQGKLLPGIYQITEGMVKTGDKIYVKLRVKVYDDVFTSFRLSITEHEEDRVDIEPTTREWQDISVVFEAYEDRNIDFYFYTAYASGAPADSAKTDVQYLSIINLSDVFGKGNEPTAEEMDSIMNKFPHGWFDGTISPLMDQREIFNYYSSLEEEQKELRESLSHILMNVPIPKQPYPPKLIPTDENGWLKYPGFEKRYRALDKDGNLYATTFSRVEKCTDIDNAHLSSNWEVLWQADTAEVGGIGVTALMVTNTNRIVVCSQFGRVFVSDENQENFTDVGIQMPFLGDHYSWCHFQFGYGHYENLVWVSSYGHNDIVANKAYLSKDYGATWEEMSDLPYVNHTHNIHVHDLQYDPYQDRFWCVFGDDNNANTFYSDDLGQTWTPVFGLHAEDQRNVQYTSIACFDHGVVFGSDQTGLDDRLDYWPRSEVVDPKDFKTIYYPDKGKGFISFALKAWQGVVGNDLITLMPWYGLSNNKTFLLATIDGKRWFEIYRGKHPGGWQIAGISSKDSQNRILGFDRDNSGNIGLMRMPLPKWINSY